MTDLYLELESQLIENQISPQEFKKEFDRRHEEQKRKEGKHGAQMLRNRLYRQCICRCG